ncbi:MAG: hypothetical protein GF334_00210 [Candidatus Altiarchaeales archaeon]|nr:hypothetical protein [Candidatus Altiarchaeales archaeon]
MDRITFDQADFPKPLCSWDIEIDSSKYFDGPEKPDYREMGITCAAAISTDGQPTELFWAGQSAGVFNPKMAEAELIEMAEYLLVRYQAGYSILTWNGLSFDFRLLAELLPSYKPDIETMALGSVDLMFQFFCQRGFFLGLDAACRGMGLAGKEAAPSINGQRMDGALAADLWPEEAETVLAYVDNDVVQPLQLTQAILQQRHLTWVTKRGSLSAERFTHLKTVQECLDLPLPDVSWMNNPPTRLYLAGFWPRAVEIINERHSF